MTPLARILTERIGTGGPISLADYMAECLLNPRHGYYATRDPFGAGGDFITAPEISQMFGELLGLCLAQCWLDQGCPAPFLLAEIGPGRGTLMADMLRAMAKVPGLRDAARIHLIEASKTLRGVQAHTLAGHDVTWRARIEDLPEGPLFLVANEFFDALPIRQFQRTPDGWAERQVGLTPDGTLCLGLAPPARYGALEGRITDTSPGDIVETCPALPPIAQDIAARIARLGGAALVIDYGDWHSLGDTFQALQGHRIVDPLAAPGDADLTAHVDFEALSQAFQAGGAQTSAMVTQGVFLERLGISARAQALARTMGGAALETHIAAHRRLTHPQEMGQLFKVIACYPAGHACPPGLEPAHAHNP